MILKTIFFWKNFWKNRNFDKKGLKTLFGDSRLDFFSSVKTVLVYRHQTLKAFEKKNLDQITPGHLNGSQAKSNEIRKKMFAPFIVTKGVYLLVQLVLWLVNKCFLQNKVFFTIFLVPSFLQIFTKYFDSWVGFVKSDFFC